MAGKLSIRTSQANRFNGKIELDGVDISHMVRSVILRVEARDVPVATLELVPEILEFDGEVDTQAHRDALLRHKVP